MYLTKAAFTSVLILQSVTASVGSQLPLSSPASPLREVACPMTFVLHKLECSVLSVPIDWKDPASGHMEISVVKSPAKQQDKRRGTIFYASALSYLGKGTFMSPTLSLSGIEMQNIIGGEYDVVMWSSRDEAFAETDGICGSSTNCFLDAEAKSSFYNATFREELHTEPRWNERMEWDGPPTTEDSRSFLHVKEKLVSRCLLDQDPAKLRNTGTAARVRDMAYLADILDGPESTINLWTEHHGSVIASYLMKLFPERVGKIVISDPVDPVAFTEEKGHIRWAVDLASANNTLALFKERLGQGASQGFQPSTGDPFINNYLFETAVEYLASELVGWRTQEEQALIDARKRIYHEASGAVNPQTYQLLQRSQRHIKMHNMFRTIRVPDLGLGAIPLVCGDSFEEYTAENASLGAELERYLVDHIDSAPLIATSAFPTSQYLCHPWPIRAAERTSLRPPYHKADLGENVLVMLHPQDTWNYFAMPSTAVNSIWPGARVISDLEYGDQVFNFNHCGTDLMADFFLGPNNARNISIPCDQRLW